MEWVAKGILSNLLGKYKFASFETGGSNSARYCYSVWLRHLSLAFEKQNIRLPVTVAELGPGDSLGMGLASLLCGANRYFALDVINYINDQRNIMILRELVNLFKEREDIPDEKEFPNVKPFLKSYKFPSHILGDKILKRSLENDRVASIEKALRNMGSLVNGIEIHYFAPWYDPKLIQEGSVDMIFSQAVLEHVEKLESTYKVLHQWLKPNGFMSHQIDFKSHSIAKEWNGHWTYSDLVCKLIRGRSKYLLNRQPCSVHIEILKRLNFRILNDVPIKESSGLKRKDIAKKYRNISDNDLLTSSAFIQAVKND